MRCPDGLSEGPQIPGRPAAISTMRSSPQDLTQGPVGRHLLRLSLPMMLGILSMVAFNIVDTYFVGQLGDRELAALTFTFPVILVIFSLIQGLGIAATAVISKSIGLQDRSKAARETTDSLFLSLIIAGLFIGLGLLSLKPLFRLIGASSDLLPLLESYMQIWYLALMFVVVPFVGNSAIRATGDATTPSLIMIFAVIINAILDPLLIFGYGPFPELGMRGAAVATALSRGATMVLSLGVLYFREKLIVLGVPDLGQVLGCWRAILRIGLPAGFSRMVTPISQSAFTAMLAGFNEHAVAAYGIGSRLEILAMSLLFALSASIGPFAGQNYGRGRLERIRQGIRVGSLFSLGWGALMGLIYGVWGPALADQFTDSPEVIENAALFLSMVPLTYGLQGISLLVNANLSTVNYPLRASALLVMQMVGIALPVAYVAQLWMGVPGVFLGIASGYALGGLAAYLFNQRWMRLLEPPPQPQWTQA